MISAGTVRSVLSSTLRASTNPVADWLTMTGAERRELLARDLYPVPDALDSYEQWEKFHGYDLADMTRAELVVERQRARGAFFWYPNPPRWVLTRIAAINEVLRVR